MRENKVIISGGGTGGHIFPAISIANGLKEIFPEMKFLFVGAKGKMEMEKVPEAGFSIVGLWISGFQRHKILKNILFPLKLLVSIFYSFFIIKRFKPNAVIGTGGFASGPILFVASILKIPTLIQEQNSFPGLTNKFLSKRANTICVAYDGLSRFFPRHKIRLTGNPVRKDILNIEEKLLEAKDYFKFKKGKKTLLVLGGSLGSRRINELIEAKLVFFKKNNIRLIWQCGQLYLDEYVKYNTSFDIKVVSFIERMDYAYAIADFIISRSGASAVSELCVVGKPVIFIPSPNVAEDHQTKNAAAISKKDAALLISEDSLDEIFENEFTKLLNSQKIQNKLQVNLKKIARTSATELIVEEITKLLDS